MIVLGFAHYFKAKLWCVSIENDSQNNDVAGFAPLLSRISSHNWLVSKLYTPKQQLQHHHHHQQHQKCTQQQQQMNNLIIGCHF